MRENNIMVTFVNRQTEIMLIDDAFNALQNYNHNNDNFLRTPIIDFFGIEGIGKTAILAYIKEKCQKQKISYISVDASSNVYNLSSDIIKQVATFSLNESRPLDENEDPFQRSIDATKSLLKQGIVVMIVDSVDASNEEMLRYITAVLLAIIDNRNLLVVLASKRGVLFDSERSISRKLTSLRLNVLDRKSCRHYLDVIKPPLKTETRKYILDWTRGYPLAMEVMTNAIIEHTLDPAQPEGQKMLLDLIIKRVIDEKVFDDLTIDQQNRYKEALTLLSVPRHFNMLIMQQLIKKFASDALKRGSNLAYMKLPGSIINDTGVLSWNIFKGGYVVDAPVRNIFLLKVRIEQTERYVVLHQFLSELNKQLAEEVTGVDRIQYLCEYLYHSAYVKHGQEFIQTLEQVQQEIDTISFESLETFEAFEGAFEQLLQDNEGEFLDILGEEAKSVETLIYQNLAKMNRQRAQEIALHEEHFYHLRKFFIYSMKDPTITDERSIWIQAIDEIIAEKSANYRTQFVNELRSSETLKKALGSRFEILSELLAEISLVG